MKKLLIVWRDVNRTDIPIIDEQHRGIVTVINSLHEAIGTKREIKILEPATEMLLAYSKLHFMTEYELLEDSKYPALEAHNKLHDQLIKDMAKHFSASRKEKDLTIMLDFLKAWWLNHINREDMLYKEHLKKFLKIDEAK
ncbi:MAG: bacteriohemerythrin [Deltaproteobacteria bacterium]|jgi:hemerythrin|nr:bacteriohemerythrin [Deltaproteobacteria bacterium]